MGRQLIVLLASVTLIVACQQSGGAAPAGPIVPPVPPLTQRLCATGGTAYTFTRPISGISLYDSRYVLCADSNFVFQILGSPIIDFRGRLTLADTLLVLKSESKWLSWGATARLAGDSLFVQYNDGVYDELNFQDAVYVRMH